MASTARGKKLLFTKVHGIGNDAIIIEALKSSVQNPNHLARKLCNRKTGIGADQLLILTKSRKCDFGVKIFNADGSEAEICGNGLRCLARYVKDRRYSAKKDVVFETLCGPITTRTSGRLIEVDMGEPRMKGKEIPVNLSGRIVNRPLRMEGKDLRITCLSVGNPHCVIFEERLDEVPLQQLGPVLETHHIFPKRVNVSFVNVVSRNEMQLRVWERGAGETEGCGSAACAATVAGVLNGFTDRKVNVAMSGGKLEVEWNQKSNHLFLRGPAEVVYAGEFLRV